MKVEDIDIYEINEAFASQATMYLGFLGLRWLVFYGVWSKT